MIVTGLSTVPSPAPVSAEQPVASSAMATADPSVVERFIANTPVVIEAPSSREVRAEEWCLELVL